MERCYCLFELNTLYSRMSYQRIYTTMHVCVCICYIAGHINSTCTCTTARETSHIVVYGPEIYYNGQYIERAQRKKNESEEVHAHVHYATLCTVYADISIS